jgi:hypothetical protein
MAPRPHAPVRLRRERWREPEPRARSRRRVHGKARSAGRQGEALMARRKEHRYSGDNGRGRNEGSDEKGFHVRERQGRVSYLPRRGERAWTRGFSIALRQILLPVAPRRASCSMRSIRRCRPAPCPAIDCGRRGLKRLHLGRGRSGPRALGQSCAASADASLGRGTCERDCGLKGSRCGLRPRRRAPFHPPAPIPSLGASSHRVVRDRPSISSSYQGEDASLVAIDGDTLRGSCAMCRADEDSFSAQHQSRVCQG